MTQLMWPTFPPQLIPPPEPKPGPGHGDTHALILKGMVSIGSNITAGMRPGCLQRHPPGSGEEYRCLYVNESMLEIKTPLYAVNQMASIWQTHCLLDGEIIPMSAGFESIMQLQCLAQDSAVDNDWHICFQYSGGCAKEQITEVIAPLQRQYLADFSRGGFATRKGNGGFFHACHQVRAGALDSI